MTTAQLAPPWPATPIRTQLVPNADANLEPHMERTNRLPDPDLLIDADRLAKTIDRLTRRGSASNEYRNWSAALRVLTAWLDGLAFSEVSGVVGVQPQNLRRILHGELALQPSKHDRIARVLRLTTRLRTLLPADEIGRWYRTSIPALKGQSPVEALKKRRIAEVERVVESYFDPSYA